MLPLARLIPLAGALTLSACGPEPAAETTPPFAAISEGADMLVMNAQAGVVLLEDGLILTPGLIGMDPETRAFVSDDPAEQMDQALDNLEAALAAAGADLEDVVQMTIWTGSTEDYLAVNAVYLERLGDQPVARTIMGFTPWDPRFKVQIQAMAKIAPDEARARLAERSQGDPS